MELKDVILSTLAEMEDVSQVNNTNPVNNIKLKPKEELSEVVDSSVDTVFQNEAVSETAPDNEMVFLTSMRERLLVLFEGFQAPNNNNIEAKVDMTLNFLEYVLVTIDSRVEELEKGRK